MNFSLYYRKIKNEELFKSLEKSSFQLTNLQNYVPLYENFFSLNATNYNSINLNQKYYFTSIKEEVDRNSVIAVLSDNSDNTIEKPLFCKFSPLLDPLKVLAGKYDVPKSELIQLPKFNDNTCFPKILDKNNSAYIDSFFTYLSSQLLHNYNYIHAIDYYGSYLATQRKFSYNIADDIDYLNETDYFHENKDVVYTIDNSEHSNIFNMDSRCNKQKILIAEKIDLLNIDRIEDALSIEIPVKNDLEYADTPIDISNVCIYSHSIKSTQFSDSISSCSSKSSNTTDGDEQVATNDESNNDESNNDETDNDNHELDDNPVDSPTDDDSNDNSSFDDDTEDNIICSIFDFPVQVITMEKCENTLDYLLENELLDTSGWVSCLFQIIMTLSVYQKAFSFTHNDLHTNNIMYNTTKKQFIHYCFNGVYYKVPTYGKIYKIIDFGRAIYKFNGKLLCSDSFHPSGDAGSQYNCEPYFNENKPRLEPNFSFDLSRLACCLFDYFVVDINDTNEIIKQNKLANLIYTWLVDDKGRNILYKTSGEERYPEFKLYKMIARTIHGAVPSKQLNNVVFKDYIVDKKKINKNHTIINCDNIPNFC